MEVINIRPIFILGCHKSGTSLLRNLLDGHKNLFVVPIESHFFQNCGVGVDYRFRQGIPKRLSIEQLKNNLINYILDCNKGHNDPYADSYTANKWDLEKFINHLRGSVVSNWKQLFDAYVEAMYYSLHGKQMPKLRFVEKSVENAEFAWILRGIYPESKFIHVIRNPYATLTAIRKHKTFNGNYPFLGYGLMSMRNSYLHLYKNKDFLPNYYVVRYEDIINGPSETMRKLTKYLEIPFQDVLCQPTQLGEKWGGNSTSNYSFNGISTIPLQKWKEEITDFEVQAVNKLFPYILNDYEYEKITTSRAKQNQDSNESKEIFLRNRIMLEML